MLQAGAGKAPINLDGVLPFDGFADVYDELHVRALAIQNADGSRACLLSVDATSMRNDSPLRTVACDVLGCERDSVWVTVTHTFSVPHVRTPEHLATDEERARNVLLQDRLIAAVRKACTEARDAMQTVCLEVARGACSVNANRDVETPNGWWLGIDPTGFSDRSVRVLRMRSVEDHKTVVTVFTADVQSSIMQGVKDRSGMQLVSADLAGEAARILERRLGGIALFVVGAAGDQTPRAKGSDALPALSLALASETELALRNARELKVDRLLLQKLTIACPAQRRAEFSSLAPTHTYEFVEEGYEQTTLYMARLGSLCVVGLQPEVDSAFGAQLRTAKPGALEVLTMVNGAQKYLPSANAYERITYEAMNSSFACGADDVLKREILSLVG